MSKFYDRVLRWIREEMFGTCNFQRIPSEDLDKFYDHLIVVGILLITLVVPMIIEKLF